MSFTRILSPAIISLEEEIFSLRQVMEMTASKEKSFTSEKVVQLSNRLDRKINEYMRVRTKKSGF